MDAGEIVIRLLADARALDKGLLYGERRIGSFSKTVTRTGDALTKGVTVPVLAAGAAITHVTLDFDKQMALIGSLVGASGKQLDFYRQKVLELGPALGKTPTELASALYFITSSGFSGAAALRVLTASAKASAAGLGDTATVADAVTSAVNAYGEKALSASRATDILLAAVREGKAEPEQLAASIGQVIPAASQLGVSFDQVAAAIASMTLTGQSASEAAVALNQVFTNSLKPTKQGADALKKVGLSYKALRDSLAKEGLLPTLDMLTEKFDGNVETMAKVFGNVRSLRAVLALTGAAAGKTAGIFGKLAKDSDDTNKAFAKMKQNDPSFELRQDWAELQKVMIEFGAVVVPMVTDVLRSGTKLVRWFDDLDDGSKKVVVAIGTIAAALPPALSLFGRMGTGVEKLVGLYRWLAKAIKTTTVEQEALNAAQAVGGGKAPSATSVSPYTEKMRQLVGGGAASGAGETALTAGGASLVTVVGFAGAALGIIAAGVYASDKLARAIEGDAAVNREREAHAATSTYSGKAGGASQGSYYKSHVTGSADTINNEKLLATLEVKASKANGKAFKDVINRYEEVKMLTAKGIDLVFNPRKPLESLEAIQKQLMATGMGSQKAVGIMTRVFGKDIVGPFRAQLLSLGPTAERVKNKVAAAHAEMAAKLAQKITMGEPDPSALLAAINSAIARMQTLGYTASQAQQAVDRALSAAGHAKAGSGAGGRIYGAHGGVWSLSSAQSFVFGEGGREIAAAIPLNSPTRAAQVYGLLQDQLARYMPGVAGSATPARGGRAVSTGSAPHIAIHINAPVYGVDDLEGAIASGVSAGLVQYDDAQYGAQRHVFRGYGG